MRRGPRRWRYWYCCPWLRPGACVPQMRYATACHLIGPDEQAAIRDVDMPTDWRLNAGDPWDCAHEGTQRGLSHIGVHLKGLLAILAGTASGRSTAGEPSSAAASAIEASDASS